MIDKNDPRLTAYAMGELDASDSAAITAAIKKSPDLQAVIAEIQLAADLASDAFASQPILQLTPEQKTELLDVASQAQTRSAESPLTATTYRPWIPVAIAASLLGLMVGGAFYISALNVNGNGSIAKSDVAASTEVDANTAAKDSGVESANDETRKNSPSSLTPSPLDIANPKADRLQAPMAAEGAMVGDMVIKSNQRRATKDLIAGDSMAALRYSAASPTESGIRPQAKPQKEKRAEEQLLELTLKNTSAADKLTGKIARLSDAETESDFLPIELPKRAKVATDDRGVDHSNRTRQRSNKSRQLAGIELDEEHSDQMVRLLASRIDPRSERQLSFAELVGPITTKPRSTPAQRIDTEPSIRDKSLETDSGSPIAGLNSNNAGPKQPTKLDAAIQLASAVWRFHQQPGSDAERSIALSPTDAQDEIVNAISNRTAAFRAKNSLEFPDPVEQQNAPVLAKKPPSARRATLATPAIAPQEQPPKFKLQSLENPSVDYTSLILQLKRSLLKRNADVLRRRPTSTPSQN